MAIGAPRICTYPGCNTLIKGGPRCGKHPYPVTQRADNRARVRQRRKDPDNAVHLYVCQRWKKLSISYRKAHPLCERCLKDGRRTLGHCVDHIVPIQQGGAPYDVENLQTLCKSCHTAKTNRERGGGSKS